LKDLALNKVGAIKSEAKRAVDALGYLKDNRTDNKIVENMDREICAIAGEMNGDAFTISTIALMDGINSDKTRSTINTLIEYVSGITNRYCAYRIDKILPDEVAHGDYLTLHSQLDKIIAIVDLLDDQLK